MKNILFFILKLFCFFIIYISISVFFTTKWINNNFAGVTFEQMLFHVNVPDNNPTHNYIADLTKHGMIYPGIITLLIIILSIDFFQSKQKLLLYSKIFTFKSKIQVYPIQLLNKYIFVFAILFFITSLSYLYGNIKINNWYQYLFEQTTLYKDEYIAPSTAELVIPEDVNNLILIYLESMESSMQSKEEGGIFDVNYIPELTKLAEENINFSYTNKVGGGIQTSFTGWTIAALVASNTGIPLKIPIHGNDMDKHQTFLPRAEALGNILEDNGFNRTLMLGSDAKFSGMDNFFKAHGNFKIMDYNYFKEKKVIHEDYYEWWGIEDYKLYDLAKQEVLRLSQQKKPFAFIMTTLDTHSPDGYLDSHCDQTYEQQYANVISFASKQAYDFVMWAKSQPFYKNTTIVILGDHISMDVDFFKDIKGSRHPYNCIINSRKEPIKSKNRSFTTYDWFPTIIESMGGKAEALGLGRSLFSKEKTLIEKMGEFNFDSELNKNSTKYDLFWINK